MWFVNLYNWVGGVEHGRIRYGSAGGITIPCWLNNTKTLSMVLGLTHAWSSSTDHGEGLFLITVTLDLLYNLGNNILFILYKVRSDEPSDVIKNWMRRKDTIEFLGLWESLNNLNFNSVEFDRIKSEAGYNSFTL